MNPWIGQSQTESNGFLDVLPWALLGGGAAGWGLYMLLKPKPPMREPAPGDTRAAPLAPIASPSRFADLASVDLRFSQVRELYRMGYLTPEQTLTELDALTVAVNAFGTRSAADAMDSAALIDRIYTFKIDVADYMRLQEQGIVRPSSVISGTRFSLVNVRPL